jgi:predicted flavoprotein YhiN
MIGLPLPITRHRGWNYAEVTAGGIPLNEIDRHTMVSRKHKGLHLVGEMLDCEGRIGGFNFQWAWATGFAAGSAIAESFQQSSEIS